jgi:hypothetical protein
MIKSPAYAWLLPQFEYSHEDVMEDGRYLDWYDRVVTMLWLEEDLDDDP